MDDRRIVKPAAFLLGMAGFLAMAACDQNSMEVGPVAEEQAVLEALYETIQDEFRAELIYQKVLGDFGQVRPFVNIINAEVRHSEAIAGLYSSRGLPVPRSLWTWEEIPSFPTLTDACKAGVVAEIENAGIYDRHMDLPLPDDVRRVFENNRRASLENHLPAFQRCS